MKIGDRVIIIENNQFNYKLYSGMTGTIKRIGDNYCRIKIDKSFHSDIKGACTLEPFIDTGLLLPCEEKFMDIEWQ